MLKKLVVLLGGVLFAAQSLFAATETVDGIKWTYTVSNGESEIRNGLSAAIPTSTTGAITIPSTLGGHPVTSIGNRAFYNCSGLASVTIPNSVTNIGDDAFRGCSGLTSVTIADSVTNIGNYAFYNCSGLTSVTIGDSVASIGDCAFCGCSGLTSVTIGDSVTSIGVSAFSDCRKLTSVHITDLATWCGISFRSALANPLCYAHDLYLNGVKITQLTIPDGVTSIESYAFYGCSGLTSVTMPDSVTSIGVSAFSDCNSLAIITIPDSVTSIGAHAFYGCRGLKSVCANSVASIEDYVFFGCARLTSVTIGNGVTSIGEYAFYNCSGLTSVTIPDAVTSIGSHAFYGCSGLTSVTIPDSVTSIGSHAFSGCRGLKSVKMPNSVASIEERAFYNCRGLTSVTIPNSVTSIEYEAFYGCSGLTSVTIGGSVTSIGYEAFRGCSSLTSVTIPDGVTSIGYEAFYGCSGLTSVTIGGSVASIGYEAFRDCSSLASVTMRGSCPEIGEDTFRNVNPSCMARLPRGNDTYAVVNGQWQGMKFVYYAPEASWTVSLNANGGTLTASTLLSVGDGKAVGTLPTPEREGFAFLGWFTAAAGGTQVTAATKVTKDVTYYAHWQYQGAADDSTIVFKTEEEYTTAGDGSFTLDLSEVVGSTSVPKVTVKGLPTGLKFDVKTLTISGTATKPGVYTVTVSATNATVKKAVTATFEIVVPNLASEVLPNLVQDTDAYGVVMCGVAFNPELVDCTSEDGWTVKAAGLPTGLKWDAKTGTITGVPTKAGTFTVTFTATRGKEKQTATITLVTEALPAWTVGTFTGVAKGEHESVGAASMSVTEAGKISGKFAIDGTNWTFAASSYAACDEDVCYAEVTAKAGRLARTFTIEVSPCESPDGTLVNAAAQAFVEDESIDLYLRRNMWKDKATSAAAKSLLQGLTGVYTASVGAGDDYGAGYLSLTVSASGDVKASGKLADGTSVSSSVPLWWNGDGYEAWFAVSPSAYKGGGVEVRVAIPQERGITTDGYCNWASRSPTATGEYGEGFVRESDIVCAYYDKLAKLNDYYETLRLETEAPNLEHTFKETFLGDNNHKQTATHLDYAEAADTLSQDGTTVSVNEKGAFTVAKATKPVQDKTTKEWSYDGANDGALTLSFTQATGIFKGSYTFWYDYQSAYDETTDRSTMTHTSKKVNFEGIWVQGMDSLDGFYLWDGTGYYEDPKTGREKSYKYKESHGVRLAP